MGYLLGIDIGTSATKAILFRSDTGEVLASSSSQYMLYQPQIGWAEQQPEDWWEATVIAIKGLLNESGVNPDNIRGIGLTGQMHGMVLMDREGNVLTPSIIWCDQRTSKQSMEIESKVGRERLIEITANPALTNFTASKALWIRENKPEVFEKIYKILLPKDFIRFKLTGEFATDVTDASGTQLLDVPNRKWSRVILDRLNIDYAWMPELYESHETSGYITQEAADITGLRKGIPVVGGAGDQAAGAVGNGIVRPGMVSSTIGTSGVIFAYTDELSIDPRGRVHTFCHAMPDVWHVMGVTQAAGLSLQWFRDNFAGAEREIARSLGMDPYVLIDEQAQKSNLGCNGLIYLPYLMGERSPHLDPNARGVFFGITAKHTKNDIIRSIMEGVAYSLRDSLEIMEEMGIGISNIRASGGGARSELWRQIQGDIFNTPIDTINIEEGPAFGAVLLAGVGAGIYDNIPQACETVIDIENRIEPVYENVAIYDRYYEVYQDLYRSLKDNYMQIAEIEEIISRTL